jgi:hypothetical protein
VSPVTAPRPSPHFQRHSVKRSSRFIGWGAGTELEVGGGASKSACPPLQLKLTAEGRIQVGSAQFCVAIPPHASAKLFQCSTGDKTTDEQRFVWKPSGPAGQPGNGTLVLAAGQFRAGECLGLKIGYSNAAAPRRQVAPTSAAGLSLP